MDTRIYVMTHKKIAEFEVDYYIPMHVGRAGKEDFGYLGDNTGENISEKNASYCELTGIYWLWKNCSCDVIGICHYRRFFVRDGYRMPKEHIERLILDYPIIIPESSGIHGREASVYAYYAECHHGKDLDICRAVIEERCPEYVQAFDYCMKSVWFTPGNMWITRKDIFDRYCAWLFDILFEAEKRIDTTGYDTYQKRVMGFLAERLFRVWLLRQPERICTERIVQIEA